MDAGDVERVVRGARVRQSRKRHKQDAAFPNASVVIGGPWGVCYTGHMNWLRRRYVRKALLLGFLAVAGILAAEVFQVLGGKEPEEVLRALHAELAMSQSMEVNGQTVTADVWRLPETSSADPLRRLRDPLLIVGRMVYVFHEDVRPMRGACMWPDDLPAWDFRPDYVVDTGMARFVNGVADESPGVALETLAARAQAQGWEALGGNVWRKGRLTLFAHAAESRRGTEAVMIVTSERD